ncbi:hypothetical protein Y1Q_0003737 [Alligator mississippiensis]|uniref:Uncharacterized protein n=1 Tax=Alligator mississippiensis TaxID=8496 RepID=A0A151MN58_ALLMI|nr:hypothetical protein Y1Q_0003737 [Alligator mississippiensis]
MGGGAAYIAKMNWSGTIANFVLKGFANLHFIFTTALKLKGSWLLSELGHSKPCVELQTEANVMKCHG